MQIEISKATTEKTMVDIDVPAFYTSHNIVFYAVTAEGVVITTDRSVMAYPIEDKESYQKNVEEAISRKQCSAKDFLKAYHQAQRNIARQINQFQSYEV